MGTGGGDPQTRQRSCFSDGSGSGRPLVEVAQGYTDRTVLLTGATGYVGSLLLEQLFRTCAGVRKVYVVVRPKRGVTPAARLASLLRGPVFHLLRARVADVEARIEVLEADIEQPGFGLSAKQRERLSDVDYIIHCAASIRFDLPVKAVLRANFLPTRALLDLAAALPGLRAFTFMSTAFANAHLPQARARQHFF